MSHDERAPVSEARPAPAPAVRRRNRPRSRVGVGGCFALAALAAACDAEAAGDGAEVLTIAADEVEVIGTSDELSRILDLEEGPDGTLWALNGDPPFFVGFDPDGGTVVAHGSRGDGPGEFQAPGTLARLGSGTPGHAGVWTYDRGRHAFLRVDGAAASGTSETAVRIPREEISPGALLTFRDGGTRAMLPWIQGTEEGFLVARDRGGNAMPVALWDAEIVVVSPDGGVTSQRDVGEILGDPDARYPGATFLLPVPIWAPCADGRLLLYDPLANELRTLGTDGREGPAVALPPVRAAELTADRLLDVILPRLVEQVPSSERPPVDELRAELEQEFSEIRDQFAEVFPEYADLRCVGDGTAWLQVFDLDGGPFGHGPEWLRVAVDEAGGEDVSAPRRVRFPERFTPLRFTTDGVLGVLLDDLDLPSVARVRAP